VRSGSQATLDGAGAAAATGAPSATRRRVSASAGAGAGAGVPRSLKPHPPTASDAVGPARGLLYRGEVAPAQHHRLGGDRRSKTRAAVRHACVWARATNPVPMTAIPCVCVDVMRTLL
jgi:hypothetical protein